jgi:hypothetical protein
LVVAAVLITSVSGQVPAPRDERFELNITDERIVENPFARSTSAVFQNEKLYFEAGASVAAGSIVLTVRGARGNVTFRARFDALERLFDRR